MTSGVQQAKFRASESSTGRRLPHCCHKVLRYSMSAARSAAFTSVPNSWPAFELPGSLVSSTVAPGKGAACFIAHRDWIEIPVAHVEYFAALGRRSEQLAQIGNRPIVQIGGHRPDAIQWAGAVLKQCAELVRPPLIDLGGELRVFRRFRDPLGDDLLGDRLSRLKARYLGLGRRPWIGRRCASQRSRPGADRYRSCRLEMS